jgi:phage terminase large subunit
VTDGALRLSLPGAPLRSWQQRIVSLSQQGIRRFILCVHRRSGKTTLLLHLAALAMVERVGLVILVLRNLPLGRRIAWDGIGANGRKLIDEAFPLVLRAETNELEMSITFQNGSRFQILGSDDPERLRGLGAHTVLFDEYSIMPSSEPWDVVRPMAVEADARVVFAFTPKGKNFACELYEDAQGWPGWHVEKLTIADTKRDAEGERGGPIVTEADVSRERNEGWVEAKIQQEFYCSFNLAQVGSVYGAELDRLEQEKRITGVPWDPMHLCVVSWDLGIADECALVVAQFSYFEVKVIDCYSNRNQPLDHYVKWLNGKEYVYGEQLLPHDADTRSLATLTSPAAMLRRLGLKARVLERVPVAYGIEQVRLLLRKCWFDKERCRPLLRALGNYLYEWDEDKEVLAPKPRHDAASHYADSFRYLACGYREPGSRALRAPRPSLIDFDPFHHGYGSGPRRAQVD